MKTRAHFESTQSAASVKAPYVSQHLFASLSITSHKSTRAQSASSIHKENSNRTVHTNSTPAKSRTELRSLFTSLVAIRQLSPDNEEVVDRGGQHHELHSKGKDQDGHRHVMSNTIDGATTGEVRGLCSYQRGRFLVTS